ncbi:MAG: hypothetical protein KGO02_01495 [Alphaproteobacteria bacterium]|nr:hypothetical protein [Alphaproteobacteria bacterium]
MPKLTGWSAPAVMSAAASVAIISPAFQSSASQETIFRKVFGSIFLARTRSNCRTGPKLRRRTNQLFAAIIR